MQLAELPEADFANQHDAARWPEMTEKLAAIIKQKTQAEWCELMEGTDVCFAPVLSFTEAPSHPANVARNTYIEVDGVTQPAPAPRFSRTPSSVAHGPRALGEDTAATLAAMGFAESEIRALRDAGTIG